jgi:hypothetical protein
MPPKKTTTKKAAQALDVPASFQPVADAFVAHRDVTLEKGWGAENVALKVKGKIFAMTVRGAFVAKLPTARVDALVDGGTATRFDAGRGRPMKEWVSMAGSKGTWVELAGEAYEFVKKGAR